MHRCPKCEIDHTRKDDFICPIVDAKTLKDASIAMIKKAKVAVELFGKDWTNHIGLMTFDGEFLHFPDIN